MALVPIRELSKIGAVPDVDPVDLPLPAWSMAVNARFGPSMQITRAPLFRAHGTLSADPRHMFSYRDPTGNQHIIYTQADGSIFEWSSSGETDLTPLSWTAADSEAVTTTCSVNGVFYSNREDRVPWYRAATGSGSFATLDSYDSGNGLTQFPSDIRCKSLRSVASVLVAINITDGATRYPQKVKWSNFASNGVPPSDWDFSATTSSSGENTLADMRGELVDGMALGNTLILYGSEECWEMRYVAGNAIFDFRRLPFSNGVINTNCVVDVGGLHYVFGNETLWINDSATQKDIATGTVKKFVFDSLIRDYISRCFVLHNPRLSEVYFCYPSDDPYCAFPLGEPNNNVGCNRAAVFNTVSNTWTFADLPYVTHAAYGTIASGVTFADLSSTSWSDLAGSWSAFGGSDTDALIFGCPAYTHPTSGSSIAAKMRSYETYASTAVSADIDTDANAPMLLEKTFTDFDELKVDLTTYKLLSSIYLQGRATDGTEMEVTVGASDHPNIEPVYGLPQTFNNDTMKLDFDIAGRFISIKIEASDYGPFTISGLDLDLYPLGL